MHESKHSHLRFCSSRFVSTDPVVGVAPAAVVGGACGAAVPVPADDL